MDTQCQLDREFISAKDRLIDLLLPYADSEQRQAAAKALTAFAINIKFQTVRHLSVGLAGSGHE